MKYQRVIVVIAISTALLLPSTTALAGDSRAWGRLEFGPTTFGTTFTYDFKAREADDNTPASGTMRLRLSTGDEYRYDLTEVCIVGDKAFMFGPMTSTNTGMGERWTYMVVWDKGAPDPHSTSEFVPDLLFEQQFANEADARAMFEQQVIPHWLLASDGNLRVR